MTEVLVPSRASENSPICGGTVANDPAGASYVLNGPLGPDVVGLAFTVHHAQAAGTYLIGAYPDGTAAAPATANVLILRTGQGFASWNSGSGTLVLDPGGRSGTLTADLLFAGWRRFSVNDSPPPTTQLAPLHVEGSWLCPAGS